MTINRKAATAAFKERKTASGIYAIHCTPSGQLWLGQANDLATVQNRHWFGLRMGSHTNRDMQRAWTTHGEAGFSFEPLEILPDEDNAITRASQLRDALKRWRTDLSAPAA